MIIVKAIVMNDDKELVSDSISFSDDILDADGFINKDHPTWKTGIKLLGSLLAEEQTRTAK